MSISTYWPSLENINDCIRTEAETVDPAVLLAVHEPGPLCVRSAEGGAEEIKTEQDLLKELLRPADDGSAVVVAITGASGVGKSHMVRWLHAQLLRHRLRDRFVIVVVPKTASLRQVVERILTPLQGGQYEHLWRELSKAIESLAPDQASELLAAALGNELEIRYQQGMQVLTAGGATSDRSFRERVAAAKGLRDVLRDPTVRDKWFGKVLKRIIRQTLEGGSESETGDLRRFVPEDLATPDDWDPSSGTPAARLYLQQLQKNDGALREPAAAVLQDVLDPALRGVFRFSEALGQKTIEEIVGDIRKELLAEGKELVLLIEDFAALAGIQQPLLNLMIAECDHQGERVRAPLRTALAVTDGFLPSRQTILTRAKREWIIPNAAPTHEQTILRFIDLAGRYLNAARWGADALRQQYRAGTGDWVEAFSAPLAAEDAEVLSAFGKSRRGYSLFPLSAMSIESLCRRELRKGADLVFIPRAFINAVLRDTLLLRPRYEQRAFPPPGFKAAVLPASAEIGLRTQPFAQSDKERLATVLVHWAGSPQDLSAPSQAARGIFQAFDLPWPYLSDRVVLPPPGPAEKGQTPTSPPPPSAREKPGTPGLVDHVERWANGELLPQAQARRVRAIVSNALKDRLDWNSLRMRSTAINAEHIWLPYVGGVGNPTTEPMYIAGEETRPLAADLRAGVVALDRWDTNQRSWDYLESEDDYALAQQLVDRLERQAVKWLTSLAERQAAVAVRVLHRQALLLRLTKAADPPVPPLAAYTSALSWTPTGPDPDDKSHAASVMSACVRAASTMGDVRRALYESIGCFQGSGAQAYAIDSRRLRSAWRAEERPDDPQQIRTLGNARDAGNELAGSRLSVLVARYRSTVESLVNKVVTLAGPDAPNDLVNALEALVTSANKASLMPSDGFSLSQAKRELAVLADETAQAHLRRAPNFAIPGDDATLHKQLAAWADWDVRSLGKTVDALDYLDRLIKGIEREAKAALKSSGGGDFAGAVAQLQTDLAGLAAGDKA